MELGRIYFKYNPWPEGHQIQVFSWSAKMVDEDVWFDFHLESADYYAERDIENDEDVNYPSDWAAPGVWGNYHSCTLSSNFWHDGGFKVCAHKEYTPEFLDGLEVVVDPTPETLKDWDDLAFHIYLLGHDAVGKHRIRFERISNNSMQFKITWLGAIAQAYVGDYEFKHEFIALVTEADFPELSQSNAE